MHRPKAMVRHHDDERVLIHLGQEAPHVGVNLPVKIEDLFPIGRRLLGIVPGMAGVQQPPRLVLDHVCVPIDHREQVPRLVAHQVQGRLGTVLDACPQVVEKKVQPPRRTIALVGREQKLAQFGQ